MVQKFVRKIVIKVLLNFIIKYVKRYGVKLFLEHFIKVIKMSDDKKMQALAKDLQLALDNYNS